MTIIEFPNVDKADETGLLAVGGDLEVKSLLLAYSSGIFPWPVIEDVLTWFAPPKRAVLFLDKFHISRSLRKTWLRQPLSFKIDSDFRSVIEHCAASTNRGKQRGTWITPEIVEAYCNFHKAGYAHSFEGYEQGKLVGGLYGVSVGGMFAGESMFFLKANASKLVLCYLVEYLKERGVEWIDCQVMTPLFASFGAEEISRKKYMSLLNESVQKRISLF